jgi:hypothetical protein
VWTRNPPSIQRRSHRGENSLIACLPACTACQQFNPPARLKRQEPELTPKQKLTLAHPKQHINIPVIVALELELLC